MRNRGDCLFSNSELRTVFEHQKAAAKAEVDALDRDYLLKVNEDDLLRSLVSKYEFGITELHADKAEQSAPVDVEIDVSGDPMRGFLDPGEPFYLRGTSITVSIPFTGPAGAFVHRPSTFTYDPPMGVVGKNSIEVTFQQVEPKPEELKREYERTIKTIQEYLAWAKNDIDGFNRQLPDFIRAVIEQRKKKLLADTGLAASLGIPLKRRPGEALTYIAPEVKRKPAIQKPEVPAGKFESEPELALEEYEHILKVIQDMVLVMERSPHAFANMDEETLRFQILVPLNGHYEGQATGETFNYGGKTDILIRVADRNIFIAECKFWKGPQQLLETINQLLGYASWRDTKTAIIIFNRNKDHSGVLAKIAETMPTHECWKQDLGRKNENHFRYKFRNPSDKNRELLLSVLTFHVPSLD